MGGHHSDRSKSPECGWGGRLGRAYLSDVADQADAVGLVVVEERGEPQELLRDPVLEPAALLPDLRGRWGAVRTAVSLALVGIVQWMRMGH